MEKIEDSVDINLYERTYSKRFWTTADLMIIMNCGADKARDVKREIKTVSDITGIKTIVAREDFEAWAAFRSEAEKNRQNRGFAGFGRKFEPKPTLWRSE